MKTTRLALTLAMAAGFAVGQPADSQGVTVELNGATLLHRSNLTYPDGARDKGVKGSVTVEVTLDATGNVSDARVLSGPDELRKAVLQSVLGWHFAHGTAGVQRQVTVAFNPPPGQTEQRLRAIARLEEAKTGVIDRARQAEASRGPRTIQSIQVAGLPDALRTELLSRLPLRAGDPLTVDSLEKASRAVREFDEHMNLATVPVGADSSLVAIQIGTSEARLLARTESMADVPGRIRVGGNVQQAKLIRQPKPVYPMEAKQARIQGIVQLTAVIGKDGTVQQLDVFSGHPLLVPSAMEAVKQWVYQTTLLNGNPVEVVTQIDVNYTLSQ